MRTPDTAHLAPEDAALVRSLYLERHAGLSRGEAARVRHDTRHANGRHAGGHAATAA